ncbi:MAG: glycosyltransferase family 2 protein [Alphaproteobacteria bacterium]|nr:glycosyltransferase family 2 protein [Alphaproteobacteria bacterium]
MAGRALRRAGAPPHRPRRAARRGARRGAGRRRRAGARRTRARRAAGRAPHRPDRAEPAGRRRLPGAHRPVRGQRYRPHAPRRRRRRADAGAVRPERRPPLRALGPARRRGPHRGQPCRPCRRAGLRPSHHRQPDAGALRRGGRARGHRPPAAHRDGSVTRISALVVARNEAAQLADCLAPLSFADEIVVVLDRTTDGSAEIAARFDARIVEGAWEREGERRNAGIAACTGPWIVEIDADERVTPALATEIRYVTAVSPFAWHELPVDNYVGSRLVRHGWGGSFGKAAYPGLFRRGAKAWGPQRVHPRLKLEGEKGPRLASPMIHLVDRNLSDMLRRLDRYTTLRAADLREAGDPGRLATNVRRLFTRFWHCYVGRKGWREGGYGLAIALFAALYPLLSHLKATLEDE